MPLTDILRKFLSFGPLPGVTKAGGASTDDFGDTSLPKGLFTKMKA